MATPRTNPTPNPTPLPAAHAPLAPLVDVTLDAAQRRAVELPSGRALLVLGEAGHGKTTVALHRLAHLARQANRAREDGAGDRAPRFRAAVVVPSEGLRGLVERALVRLGVDVPALTFDVFARRQARRAFDDLPKREGRDATPATSRVKRDPALAIALEELAKREPGVIDDDEDAPPVITRAHAVRGDLQHLFGDRALLEAVARASGGRIAGHAVAEALDHTRVQFGMTGEEAWAHVDDARRLVTVDRRSLDDGTPDADARSIDPEDYAVLFEIDRLRAARLGVKATRPRAYDCLVLDEAQELAPIELALLGRSLAPGASLVVAGDADQQLDDRACFTGWEDTMRALGHAGHDRVVLDVSYRCPPDVVALAKLVLGAGPPPARDAIAFPRFATEADLTAWMVAEIAALEAADERASVAVIVRSPLTARRLAALVRKERPARLVLDGEFRFVPGVDVTIVDHVRGLEFDHVIVADAGVAAYPDDPPSRRALYVAVTRARRSVRLATVSGASPIVAALASAGA